ncbi:MAG: MBL fold metallo-hydrolase [Calditrichaeota bacterium]|nr:MBL fold metallo-hydrolase [Calditrichota bacterium]MCB9367780.1 MBL fold metallo-hydrolase [Calditrichota bacterium]
MHIDLGTLRIDVLDDGLFELRAETFVKVTKGRNADLLKKGQYKPRIKVGFNSLLIRGEGQTVLIDPGTGDKERIAERRSYNLDWPRRVLPKLKQLGVRKEDVTLVVLTHLHWDHAGACTTNDLGGQLEPTFPKACHVLHEKELDGARAALVQGDDGYCADDFEPLAEARKLELIGELDAVIFPWLTCHWSGGHSPGHMVVRVGYPEGPRVMYPSDVLPTAAQLPFDSGMSYDQDPNELIEAKRKFLEIAAADEDLVILVHAPRNKSGYIRKLSSGEYKLEHVALEK